MKVAGIIAEYNPFHNGHRYHIEETRRLFGADYVIIIMSGNFVQRGAPALLDKYTRAAMALQNGADIVIELPAVSALESAEGFARGGVSLLHALGVVTDLSFGCEIERDTDISRLHTLAEFLSEEPKTYRTALSARLKEGFSFPAARTLALRESLPDSAPYVSLLEKPNNILAIEYQKAILRENCAIQTHPIPRRGSAYHDPDLGKTFASASAIRTFLLCEAAPDGIRKEQAPSLLAQAVPENVLDTLWQAACEKQLLQEDDFSLPLFYALAKHRESLVCYGYEDPDLAARAAGQLEQFSSWSGYAAHLKTRNRTYTAISRYLAHILTGITGQHLRDAAGCGRAPYARVLGFRRSAAPLLDKMNQTSRIPVITRLAAQERQLSDVPAELLKIDLFSSCIYNHVLFLKSGKKMLSEYRHPLVYL